MYPQRLLRRRTTTPPFSDVDMDDTERLLRSLPVVRAPSVPVTTPPFMEQPTLERRLPIPATTIDIGPPPLTRTGARNRPQILPGFENELEAQRQLRSQIGTFQPQKRTGWKDFGLGALQGFLRGGLPGAAAMTLYRVIDPDFEDEAWQQQQLQRTNTQIDQLMQEQRVGLQDELLRSQVEENRAQAERARQPATTRPITNREQLPDGTVILTELNRETGQFEPALRDGQPIILTRPRAERRVEVETPSGRLLVSPEAALGYYGQTAGVERQGQIAARSIVEAEAAERDALEKRKTASENLATLRKALSELKPTTAPDSAGRINDPNYWAEYDKLEALIKDAETDVGYRQHLADQAAREAREWRAKGGMLTRNPPPPPGVTEAKVRAEARSRKEDEEEAVRKARAWKWIP